MSVTPQTLASVDNTTYWQTVGSYEYRWVNTSGSYEEYRLWDFNADGWESSQHDIRVNTTTNTWEDLASGQPTLVTENNGIISLINSGNGYILFKFTKPTTASWISTLELEGSSTPSGSFYFNAQNQLVFVISSSSPSSDGTISYKIFRRPVGGTLQQAYVVSHTTGQTTEYNIGINLSLYDRWELRIESSSGLYESALLAFQETSTKKVFCNFW
jgi:hypothetical protein